MNYAKITRLYDEGFFGRKGHGADKTMAALGIDVNKVKEISERKKKYCKRDKCSTRSTAKIISEMSKSLSDEEKLEILNAVREM